MILLLYGFYYGSSIDIILYLPFVQSYTHPYVNSSHTLLSGCYSLFIILTLMYKCIVDQRYVITHYRATARPLHTSLHVQWQVYNITCTYSIVQYIVVVAQQVGGQKCTVYSIYSLYLDHLASIIIPTYNTLSRTLYIVEVGQIVVEVGQIVVEIGQIVSIRYSQNQSTQTFPYCLLQHNICTFEGLVSCLFT